jgi:hypothetical protein
MHDERKQNKESRDEDASFVSQAFARTGRPLSGDQEQPDDHEHAEHQGVVREWKLRHADSEPGGEDSANRVDRLRGEQPPYELSEVVAPDFVKEEAEGKMMVHEMPQLT